LQAICDFFSQNTNLLGAAIVSAIISSIVSYFFKRRENRDTLRITLLYDQRRKLSELIGRYKGRLISTSVTLSRRLDNLFENEGQGWLRVHAEYPESGYYFTSMVYRFLNMFVHIRQLESEAILLDTKVAQGNDFMFLNYTSAMLWVMTDVTLFDGLDYDIHYQKDHFFSDNLRFYCDLCLKDGVMVPYSEFKGSYLAKSELRPVYQLFDSLEKKETRFRWDRIVSLDLVLLAFINSFGYKRQYSNQSKMDGIGAQMVHGRILANIAQHLNEFDLDRDKEGKRIKMVYERRQRMDVVT
jgi:hypothetical protein